LRCPYIDVLRRHIKIREDFRALSERKDERKPESKGKKKRRKKMERRKRLPPDRVWTAPQTLP